MDIGIPNLSGTPTHQGVVPYKQAANVPAKASALTGDILEVRRVQPAIVASLREAASEQGSVRPEMVKKGSAFLADPHYPPLDSVNAIASIFIDDFFLNKQDPDSL